MKPAMSAFPRPRPSRLSGSSLAEVVIAVACAVVIGGVAMLIYTNSLDLFRNNSGLNFNHESARSVIDRLEKEIQSAISIPALVGLNRDIITTVETTGPAPGVAFLRQSGPVRRVITTALAGTTVVQLDEGPPIKVGQRLLIPAYHIEGDVVAVNGTTVSLASPLQAELKVTNGALTRNIVAIVTDLVTYVVVENGGSASEPRYELREYQNAASNEFNLVATGLTEPMPFSLPFNAVPGATPSS